MYSFLHPFSCFPMLYTLCTVVRPQKDLWSEGKSWEQTDLFQMFEFRHIHIHTRRSSLGSGDFPGHRGHDRVKYSDWRQTNTHRMPT